MNSFELSPGIVVDLTTMRAYVMNPEGGVTAVNLNQGTELWTSKAGAKPLAVSGDVLVSQAATPEGSANELKIVTLNREGRPVLEQTIPLPPNVKASVTQSAAGSFAVQAESANDEAAVYWRFKKRLVRGRHPHEEILPGQPSVRAREEKEEKRETQATSGAFRINLRSGKVTPQPPASAEAALARRSKKNLQLAAPERLLGVASPQFLSADDRYVMTSERVADGALFEQYLWTIYERNAAEPIGKFRIYLAYAPFFVVDSLVVYQASPYRHRTTSGMVEEPAQIRAVDLGTGKTVWFHPVRDTTDRSAPPP